jgi:hypothetical protein
LFDRAINGISDLQDKTFKPETKMVNENGENADVKNFSTTQLLKTESYTDGTKENTYATTNFVIVPMYDHIQSYPKWDSTYGVKAYSTIYWNNWYDPNGLAYLSLQQVVGGWTVNDGTISTQLSVAAEQGRVI